MVNCRFRSFETMYDPPVCVEMNLRCTWIDLEGASRNAFLAGIAMWRFITTYVVINRQMAIPAKNAFLEAASRSIHVHLMVLIHGNNRRRIVREFAENSRWIRLRDAFFVQTADLLRGYIEKMRRRILCVKERSVFESHCCRCIAIVLKFGSLKMASNLATDLSFLNDFSILNARNVGFWNYTGFMT